MTVIAWDGRTLAADKQATAYNLARTVTKLRRLNVDEIVAFAGNEALANELLHWLQTARDPKSFPTLPGEDSVHAVLVHRSGKATVYEGRAYAVHYEDPFFAAGAGRDYALATMHLGFDARRAVEVASAFDTTCGRGVDTLSFDDA